jgi:hypothetical protein
MASVSSVVLGCVFVSAIYADTITFTNFRNIDAPHGSVSMNTAGDIAGSSTDRGFVRLASGALISPIGYPPGLYTKLSAINDAGAAVGYYLDIGPHGFVYNAGTYTTIPVSEGNIAAAINNTGDVVGFYTRNLSGVGFIVLGGMIVTAGFPDGGSRGTFPSGINDAGYVVGGYYGVGDQTGGHAFIRAPDGSFTTFDFSPTATGTGFGGINNAGIVLGGYGDNTAHIFLRYGGTNYPYDPPGATTSYGLSITNNNQLFGRYFIPFDATERFFLVDVNIVPEPVPEPAAWRGTALALVLLVLAALRPRRRSPPTRV